MFYAKVNFGSFEVKSKSKEDLAAIIERVNIFFADIGQPVAIETGEIKDTFDADGKVVGSMVVADIEAAPVEG